jgi:hypothetical protein
VHLWYCLACTSPHSTKWSPHFWTCRSLGQCDNRNFWSFLSGRTGVEGFGCFASKAGGGCIGCPGLARKWRKMLFCLGFGLANCGPRYYYNFLAAFFPWWSGPEAKSSNAPGKAFVSSYTGFSKLRQIDTVSLIAYPASMEMMHWSFPNFQKLLLEFHIFSNLDPCSSINELLWFLHIDWKVCKQLLSPNFRESTSIEGPYASSCILLTGKFTQGRLSCLDVLFPTNFLPVLKFLHSV